MLFQLLLVEFALGLKRREHVSSKSVLAWLEISAGADLGATRVRAFAFWGRSG
jgi:hypothetical protein